MAGYMNVPAAIEVAKRLLTEKQAVLKNIDTVRADLRHAVTRKETDPEQTKWIGEQFPAKVYTRPRKKRAETTANAA
jgi:hypothetical protein